MITAEEIASNELACILATVEPAQCSREVDANLIHHLRELYGEGKRPVLAMMECFQERVRGLYAQQLSVE